MNLNIEQNERGFDYINFKDKYGEDCVLMKSSAACYDAIWLGIKNPKVMFVNGTPTNYPLPEGVKAFGQMHLTRQMVQDLLPHLQKFAETGDL